MILAAVRAFLTKHNIRSPMSKLKYWTDTIVTGPDSSMAGIMGSPETIDKLHKLCNLASKMVKTFRVKPVKDKKGQTAEEIDKDIWLTTINTGSDKICGLMFHAEHSRDNILEFLNDTIEIISSSNDVAPDAANVAAGDDTRRPNPNTRKNPNLYKDPNAFGTYFSDGSGTIGESVDKPATNIDTTLSDRPATKVEATKAAPTKAEPVKAEATKAAPTKPEPAKAVAAKAAPTKAEPAPKPVQTKVTTTVHKKDVSAKAEPAKAVAAKATPAKAVAAKATPAKAVAAKATPAKAEPGAAAKPNAVKTESKAKPTKRSIEYI